MAHVFAFQQIFVLDNIVFLYMFLSIKHLCNFKIALCQIITLLHYLPTTDMAIFLIERCDKKCLGFSISTFEKRMTDWCGLLIVLRGSIKLPSRYYVNKIVNRDNNNNKQRVLQ